MAKLTIAKKQKKEWAQLFVHPAKHNTKKKPPSGCRRFRRNFQISGLKIGKWDELKVSITITREEQLKSLYRQLAEMNRSIAERELNKGNRYPTSAEADTISKLANAIDKLETETGLNEILSSFKEFLGWLRKFDIATAQKIVPLFDDFVKTKLR